MVSIYNDIVISLSTYNIVPNTHVITNRKADRHFCCIITILR